MTNQVDLYDRKYPANWIVMQNRILQAFYAMTLDEKRLLLLASSVVRLIDATEKDAIEISAKSFAEACNIQVDSAYTQLKDASETMMRRFFSYRNERGGLVNVQWVIRSIYEDGCVSLCFTDEVLLMLKVFDRDNPFTKYKKEDVLKLRGEYSIDLYHLAKKYEGMTSWTMSLEEIREELSLSKSYERINNLKTRVINPSVEEITKKTDINITYENVKRGRTVTGLEFTVTAKPSKKKGLELLSQNDESREIAPLTVKQIDRFAPLLANYSPFGSHAPQGKSTQEVISWLHTQLRDSTFLKKHKKYLLAVGYTHPKQAS